MYPDYENIETFVNLLNTKTFTLLTINKFFDFSTSEFTCFKGFGSI